MPTERTVETSKHRELALFIAAFASNEAWYMSSFWNFNLFGDLQQGASLLSETYLTSIVAYICILICLFVSPRLRRKLNPSASRLCLLAIVMTASTLLTFVPSILSLGPGATTAAIFTFGSILTGITSGIFTILFALLLSKRGFKTLVTSIVAGEAISIVVYDFMLAFPAPLFAAAAALLPIASTTCLVQCLQGEVNRLPLSNETESHKRSSFASKNLTRFALFAFLVGVANEANRFLYDAIGIPQITSGDFVFCQSLTVLIVVAFCAITLKLLLTNSREIQLSPIFWIVFGMLLISTLALPLAKFFPETPLTYILFNATNSAAYECVLQLIWIIPAALAANSFRNVAQIFISTRLAWALGQLAGLTAVGLLDVAAAPNLTYIYSTCIVLIIVLAFLAIFPEKAFSETITTSVACDESSHTKNNEAPISKNEPGEDDIGEKHELDIRLANLAKEYALTDRELEVMALLAQGRNSSYIQDTLFLSKSTVSTHRQHVYQKLGVHSQQQLMSIVLRDGTAIDSKNNR